MPEQSVAEFFDLYSADFNALYGSRKNAVNAVIDRLFRKSMRLRFEYSIQGCQPIQGKRVLDVGCGPGHYSVHLAKQGAAEVLGLDFAPGMIDIAWENARRNGVLDRCHFIQADFLSSSFGEQFDYAIAMGFMDYIEYPSKVIDKILAATSSKAFFSFPVAGGLLAWQRKQRYKNRCQLFLYNRKKLNELFTTPRCKRFEIKTISRDYFVTAFPA
jgi:2-polyprenyl-3-methyl-5-hydroxy-6-metoxy-1,4-benzoquinol methylase